MWFHATAPSSSLLSLVLISKIFFTLAPDLSLPIVNRSHLTNQSVKERTRRKNRRSCQEFVEMARIKPKALLAQSKQKKRPAQFSVTSLVTYLIVAVLAGSALYAGYKYFLQSTPQRNN